MKKWQNDTWEVFNKVAKGKKVILYGAGDRCKNIVSLLKLCYKIEFIVDKDPFKWGKSFYGIFVESPEKLDSLKEDSFVVLITAQKTFEIACELEKRNIKYYYSEFWMNNTFLFKEMRTDSTAVDEKLDYLSDEKSKDIYKKIIEKRISSIADYSDIMEEEEYFNKEFFKPKKRAVYIDAGAFNGDTIEKFIMFNSDFKKVYAFEADKKNYEKLKNSFIYQGFKDNIQIYNYGLYNKNAILEFNGELGISSNIANEAMSELYKNKTTHVKCVKLDEIVNEEVTFIKMDIEGSEMKALEGAKNIICKYKPDLAICIYHKPDDLWRIPKLIHEMVPEYKLYIRHHSCVFYDTVLYATM